MTKFNHQHETYSAIESAELSNKYAAYNKISLNKMIRSDVRRWEKASVAFFKLGFYAAFFYRISRYLALKKICFGARLIQFVSHFLTGAEISNKAIIGPGLIILHPTAVHIGPGIRIGKNACICEGCSIVTNVEFEEGEPVVGDFLWASSGSKIMGPITLGDHVWVGPNTVLLKNVDSNMTAFGIPARIMPKSFRRKFADKSRVTVKATQNP